MRVVVWAHWFCANITLKLSWSALWVNGKTLQTRTDFIVAKNSSLVKISGSRLVKFDIRLKSAIAGWSTTRVRSFVGSRQDYRLIHWSPTGLVTHLSFFKVALPDFILGRIFYVYQYIVVVQEPLIDSLFKNQTVINDVNTTGNRYQKPTDVPIPDISHLVHRRICTSYSITWAIWGYHRLWTKEQQSQFLLKSIT